MKFSKSWWLVNLLLLSAYLLFFHLCLLIDNTIFLGISFSLLICSICVVYRKAFKNSYEFFFYIFLAVDVFIEGFIPLHEGYTFYACALGFWTVFIIYHFTRTDKLQCLGSKAR